MFLATAGAALLCILILAYARLRKHRRRRELESRTVSAANLHAELTGQTQLHILDVRQPLDLLAYPESIPTATRVAPRDILEGRASLPADRPIVVYCTCPGDETSLKILHRALDLNLPNIRLLRGGLAAWKAAGYPVEPYTNSFHLDTPGGAA